MSPLKRYRDRAIVVLLLAVPFFFLRANMKKPENLNPLDRLALRISAPFEYAAAAVARQISNGIQRYTYKIAVNDHAEQVEYENARLREDVHRLAPLEAENRELRRLLQLKQTTLPDAISAHVIGKDYSPFFRVTRLWLDRSAQTVLYEMPVVTVDGVVGKVQRVEGNSVDVELAVDAPFGVDVEDERTHTRGFIKGTGDNSRYACHVEMVSAEDEVEIGDLLITSGIGKIISARHPVARVTKIEKREVGREQDVEAVPTVNFSQLEYVLILPLPRDEEGTKSSGKPKGK